MSTTLEYKARTEISGLNEPDLILAVLAGSAPAFTELYNRYQTRIINHVWRMVSDREKAEDIMQVTFMRVHQHLHRFDRTRKFSTWVFTIAGNLAKNELRNRSRNPVITFTQYSGDSDRPLRFEDSRNTSERLFHNRQLRKLVESATRRLPAHHREVFVLREMHGKSYEEIAKITKSNLGTIKSRLNRARTAFAAIIKPHIQ